MNGKKNEIECNQQVYAFVQAAVHAMSVSLQGNSETWVLKSECMN
jgi:hypothetical protein